MSREKQARSYHAKGYSCSQAVYSAYADLLGIKESEAKRISSPWAGGAKVRCGGVYSALQIIDKIFQDDEKEKTRVLEEFKNRYIKENGSLDCRELMRFRAKNGKSCRDYVGSAAAILEELCQK